MLGGLKNKAGVKMKVKVEKRFRKFSALAFYLIYASVT